MRRPIGALMANAPGLLELAAAWARGLSGSGYNYPWPRRLHIPWWNVPVEEDPQARPLMVAPSKRNSQVQTHAIRAASSPTRQTPGRLPAT